MMFAKLCSSFVFEKIIIQTKALLISPFFKEFEDISGLMNPATLMNRLRKHVPQRFPKNQSTIANCQLRWMPEVLCCYPQQQLRPALFRLPITVLNGNKFFPDLFCDSDNDKDTLLGMIASDIEVNTVCPDINILLILKGKPGKTGTELFFISDKQYRIMSVQEIIRKQYLSLEASTLSAQHTLPVTCRRCPTEGQVLPELHTATRYLCNWR